MGYSEICQEDIRHAQIIRKVYLLGYRDVDTGHMIENLVCFELLRRGYDVAVGKIGNIYGMSSYSEEMQEKLDKGK